MRSYERSQAPYLMRSERRAYPARSARGCCECLASSDVSFAATLTKPVSRRPATRDRLPAIASQHRAARARHAH